MILFVLSWETTGSKTYVFVLMNHCDKIKARLNDDQTESSEQAAQILKCCICAQQHTFHF